MNCFCSGDFVVMDTECHNRMEKMLSLQEKLIAVEKDRLAGRAGCTLDELEAELETVIINAEKDGRFENR
jgi:hypothetical protein